MSCWKPINVFSIIVITTNFIKSSGIVMLIGCKNTPKGHLKAKPNTQAKHMDEALEKWLAYNYKQNWARCTQTQLRLPLLANSNHKTKWWSD